MSSLRLILFFTRGVSLKTWDQVGMFEREVALYKRLQEHGVQVTFVTYGSADDLRYADRIPGISILCNRWGLPQRLYEKLLPMLHARNLSRADVYKTNQINGAEIALQAARLFRKPLIARCGYMWSRFASHREGDDSALAKRARKVERQVFSAAAQVVVTAEHMKQYIETRYGIQRASVTVIPNYVLTDIFRPEPQRKPSPKRICFVGRLNTQKNLLALLEASQGLDIELEIIGNGPQRNLLQQEARDRGINVRFLGSCPHSDLPKHFNAAEIVILPSLYEGHPKVLLEAMACGRPVIGTDVIGIRDLIEHRETGYLCDTSPESIRAALRDVLSDEALRAYMGGNAREFVLEHFSLGRVVERELAVLKTVKRLAADRSWLGNMIVTLAVLGKLLAQTLQEVFFLVRRLAMRLVRRVAKRALRYFLRLVPTSSLEHLIYRVAAQRADVLSPDEALRFLFRIDAMLYPLWGQHAIEYEGGIHPKHRHIGYHGFFISRVREDQRVLDIGCGNGALSHDVAEKSGAEVVGIDLNPDNIDLAHRQYAHPRVAYYVGDVLHDLPEGTFDVIIMSNVLEHLPDRPAFLRRAQEVAHVSHFLIRVPLLERHWSVPLKRELGVEWRLDPTHYTEYTIESFVREMAEAGLRIQYQEIRWGEIWAEVVSDA